MSLPADRIPLRTPLGRVRGLGSAKGGTHHWWLQRVTSIALLPLFIWFVVFALSLIGATQPQAAQAIGAPLNAVLLLALLGIAFHHTASGLQVVVEDYVKPEAWKLGGILAIKAICMLLALASMLAVVRLAVRAGF